MFVKFLSGQFLFLWFHMGLNYIAFCESWPAKNMTTKLQKLCVEIARVAPSLQHRSASIFYKNGFLRLECIDRKDREGV